MKYQFLIKVSILFLSITNLNALEDGTYKIKSLHSAECLELESFENNYKLIESKCNDRKSQLFEFTNIEKNTYYISTLAVANKSKDSGAHFFSSQNPNEFILIEHNNTFLIKNKESEKFLTLIPYTNEVIQSNNSGRKEHYWKILKE